MVSKVNMHRLVHHLYTLEHNWDDEAYVDSDKFFSMAAEYFACDSPACVAGHCRHLFYDSSDRKYPMAAPAPSHGLNGATVIGVTLGLREDAAWDLYKGHAFEEELSNISPQMMADYLKKKYLDE